MAKKLTKNQKEIISDHLASFFLNFWNNKELKNNQKRDYETAAPSSGFKLGDFPEKER